MVYKTIFKNPNFDIKKKKTLFHLIALGQKVNHAVTGNSCLSSLVLVEVQQPSVVPPRRVFSSALKLDEEARRRSEMATKQLMQNYHGPPNVGIKLMSKMGYGVAGEHPAALHPCIFFWLLRGFYQAAPQVRAVAIRNI